MLITQKALDANRREHGRIGPIGPHILPAFGVSGWRWFSELVVLANIVKPGRATVSVLDYGAGKGTLAEKCRHEYARFVVQNYDPVTFPTRPRPAEIVVMTDVLEFIEPASVGAVLADVKALAKKAVLFVSPQTPKNKIEWHAQAGLYVSARAPACWATVLGTVWPRNQWRIFVPGPKSTPRFMFRGFV